MNIPLPESARRKFEKRIYLIMKKVVHQKTYGERENKVELREGG